ncbi:MAG TPA: hypothetical protein ENN19_04815 [Chloroflexi bacterium]|nr:hypothetical protein [Chloroflexota bacterium]
MSLKSYRDFVRSVIETLESLELTYSIGGSFASMYYGEVRTTQDIDISVVLPMEEGQRFVTAFQSLGYYVHLEDLVEALVYEQPSTSSTLRAVTRPTSFSSTPKHPPS